MELTYLPGVQRSASLEAAWFALYTRHQHEKVIAHVLENKGFEVFLPLYTTARRWKDRTKQLSLPLFPCYLFLRTTMERRLDIITTPGIVSILGGGGESGVILESEINGVRQVVERGAEVEPHPFLRCGDWVRVKSGPLEGVEGILVRKKNLFRLVLSVELLEKSAAVEVDVSSVERVACPATHAGLRRARQPLEPNALRPGKSTPAPIRWSYNREPRSRSLGAAQFGMI
jgi:transcription antitermination factor NusG